MKEHVPVALFAYSRPNHMARTLECLRFNEAPLIYAFSDGPKTPDVAPRVARVREILRQINWCEVILCERSTNLGLGRSILSGVTEVLESHSSVLVFEDDLICVPGTYRYLVSALNQYESCESVMSVTGWNHPRVIPNDVSDQPYFDGRSECWVWGTWARAWRGMEQDALALMSRCESRGIDVWRYGADLPEMAEDELKRNIWAVRFLYLHILRGGLCVRPPWSMVEHIGFDDQATNASDGTQWSNPPLRLCPPIPEKWPSPTEHPECAPLWQKACGTKPAKTEFQKDRAGEMPFRFSRNEETGKHLMGYFPVELVPRRVKEVVKLITPPIVINLAKKILSSQKELAQQAQVVNDDAPSSPPEFEYIPEGWNYADGHPEVKGWDVPDIIDVHRSRWEDFRRMAESTGPFGMSPESDLNTNVNLAQHNTIMIFAYAIALASRESTAFSLLDWGGGLGNYYLLARSLLPDVTIDYHCKDVPGMAALGSTLLPDQHFYSNDSCLNRKYDFILASSSMHYSEKWEDLFAKLANCCGKYVLVSRMPVVDLVPSYVFLQRAYAFGYNTEYLGWCINRDLFLTKSRESGLRLVCEFMVGENIPIQRAPEQPHFVGFLFSASFT